MFAKRTITRCRDRIHGKPYWTARRRLSRDPRTWRGARLMADGFGSRGLAAGVALVCTLADASPGNALYIQVTDRTVGGSDPVALAGMEQAAAMYEGSFADPVTLRIDFEFTPFGPGSKRVIGQTTSFTAPVSYGVVHAALASEAKGPSDRVAVANLPSPPSLRFLTQDQFGNPWLDADTGASSGNAVAINNEYLRVNTANAKALGITRDANNRPLATTDASVRFNSDFSFDYDRSDGINPGQLDFVGVAAHEIGHGLGFVSGVDTVDFYSAPNGPRRPGTSGQGSQGTDLDRYAVYSVLDLYRYSADSLAVGADVLDLRYGGHPFFYAGGPSRGPDFSTGTFNGDGSQASHWRAAGYGMFDPTAAFGQRIDLIPLEYAAFDVIGYDRVPEPATLLVFALGLAGLGGLCRAASARSLPPRPGNR